jgi:hypothetical protein
LILSASATTKKTTFLEDKGNSAEVYVNLNNTISASRQVKK